MSYSLFSAWYSRIFNNFFVTTLRLGSNREDKYLLCDWHCHFHHHQPLKEDRNQNLGKDNEILYKPVNRTSYRIFSKDFKSVLIYIISSCGPQLGFKCILITPGIWHNQFANMVIQWWYNYLESLGVNTVCFKMSNKKMPLSTTRCQWESLNATDCHNEAERHPSPLNAS